MQIDKILFDITNIINNVNFNDSIYDHNFQIILIEAINYYENTLIDEQNIELFMKLLMKIGNCYLLMSKKNNYDTKEYNINESIKYYNLSLELDKNKKYKENLIQIFLNLGDIYYEVNQYTIALTNYDYALKHYYEFHEKKEYDDQLLTLLNIIGETNYKCKKYKDSLKYYDLLLTRKIDKCKNFEDIISIINKLILICNVLGNIYEVNEFKKRNKDKINYILIANSELNERFINCGKCNNCLLM